MAARNVHKPDGVEWQVGDTGELDAWSRVLFTVKVGTALAIPTLTKPRPAPISATETPRRQVNLMIVIDALHLRL
jgi:hypothetical protein